MLVKVQSTLTKGFGDLMTKQIRVLTSLLLVYAQYLHKLKELQLMLRIQNGSFKDKANTSVVPWKDSMRRTCKISYISWVAGSISSLVVFAQVMVFAIAQASNSKVISKTKILWTLYVWLLLGLRNRECSCWKALSFFSWVELLQLSWAFSTELNFFSWVERFQLSWTSTSTVKLSDQNHLNLPPCQLNWGFYPKCSSQNQLNRFRGAVQLVTRTSAQSDL
jgi:hypothetical protein